MLFKEDEPTNLWVNNSSHFFRRLLHVTVGEWGRVRCASEPRRARTPHPAEEGAGRGVSVRIRDEGVYRILSVTGQSRQASREKEEEGRAIRASRR